jgi:tetratricopeptide (TPR) repeat protein
MCNRSGNIDEHNYIDGLQRSKEQWIDIAIALYKAKHYAEVIHSCEQALQLDNNYTRAYHGKALALIGLQQHEEAVLVCDLAIQLEPLKADLYIARGDALFAINRYEEAQKTYKQAVKVSGNMYVEMKLRTKLVIAEGKHLFSLSRFKEALDKLNMVNPKFAEAYVLLGEVLCELDRYYDARKAYEEAFRFSQHYQRVYFEKGRDILNKGKKHFELKNYNQALEFFENAILFGPLQNEAYAAQGRCLFELKRYDAALTAFRNAVVYGPKSPENERENKRYIYSIEQILSQQRTLSSNQKHPRRIESIDEEIIKLMVDKRSYNWKKISERSDIEEEFATEVADPDEYDENYNQYYDLGEIYEEEIN